MVREKVSQGSLAPRRDCPYGKTDIFRIEQVALFTQRTQFIDQILRLMGCGLITLDEYLAPPGAYGNTEGFFDKLEILGETAIEEW